MKNKCLLNKKETKLNNSIVTLENWRLPPFNRSAFSNVREIIPTSKLNKIVHNTSLNRNFKNLNLKVSDLEENNLDLEELLRKTTVDCFCVSSKSKPVFEWSSENSSCSQPHIIFSVSKSMTALLVGCLVEDGLIQEDTLVSHIFPETFGSAFEDASIRNLLDMSVSSNFVEDYLATSGIFIDYRQSTGWNPQDIRNLTDLKSFLFTLKKGKGQHGKKFEYHSTNSDMLGLIIEKLTGKKYGELFYERLLEPLDAQDEAYISVDRVGTPRAAGGICISARDLMKICEMVRCLGKNEEGRQVFPKSWIEDILIGASEKEFVLDGHNDIFPKGLYRSKWYRPFRNRSLLFGLGIHGQWIWIDFDNEISIVCFSSEPKPIMKNNIILMKKIFNQITEQLKV